MVKEGKVKTVQNNELIIQVDTICIHGDGAHALDFRKVHIYKIKRRWNKNRKNT